MPTFDPSVRNIGHNNPARRSDKHPTNDGLHTLAITYTSLDMFLPATQGLKARRSSERLGMNLLIKVGLCYEFSSIID